MLLRKLREQLQAARQKALADGYQQLLSGSWGKLLTDETEEWAFNFPREYTPASYCGPGYGFAKHFYHPGPGEMKNSGEEFECAQELDRLPEVEFWVRNLAGKHRVKSSF